MRKYFIVSMFAVFGIVTVADACPQAVRRERVISRPVRVQRERVVVRERVVAPVQRERIVVREQYTAPVVERVVVEKQVGVECQTGHCQQNFRRVERVRSSY